VVHSLDRGLAACDDAARVFIIGGAQLYCQALDRADTLVLSELEEPVEGDVFFPRFSCPPFVLVREQAVDGPRPYVIRTYSRTAAGSV
jgi:dihydrofolate reductase